MHRFILDAPHGMEVDHKNGDGLDCRRENMRLATRKQNAFNRKRPSVNTSGFKGVTLVKPTGKWLAQIEVGGKNMHLGTYESKIEAARAYDKAAIKYHGEFARLNFENSD